MVTSSLPFSYKIEREDSSLLVFIETNLSFRIRRERFSSRFVDSFSWEERDGKILLRIKPKHENFRYDHFTLSNPFQIVIDLTPLASVEGKPVQEIEKGEEESEKTKESEQKTSSASGPPEYPSRRDTLNLSPAGKTIVIDPGHGGTESGAVGKFGSMEKDVTLPISLRLKNIIERNLAYNVVMTREEDINISLENRSSIANNNSAVLFISIHANSSNRKEATGSETYFLSLNATDEEARRLAYLENATSSLEENIEGENEDEIKLILWDMAQSAFIRQSSMLAESIQNELNQLLGTKNRGIKQAPFKVLTGVACPAVLVEVAFISNPKEERELQDSKFQSDVALAIYRGLANFLRSYAQE
ncbi:MAG: N-acetylmuramoyl-L-alanine amidase [Candidatus Aminicenantes bacterium]|nr:N-acetylmuramoyl-L-alanine amidase [Candidatus Aminicenantes bacterium]